MNAIDIIRRVTISNLLAKNKEGSEDTAAELERIFNDLHLDLQYIQYQKALDKIDELLSICSQGSADIDNPVNSRISVGQFHVLALLRNHIEKNYTPSSTPGCSIS